MRHALHPYPGGYANRLAMADGFAAMIMVRGSPFPMFASSKIESRLFVRFFRLMPSWKACAVSFCLLVTSVTAGAVET